MVSQAGTSQGHCKEMDKVLGKYPPGTLQVHSQFSQPVSLQCPQLRKCSVHSQCPRSCDQGVPIGNIMGTLRIFPKNVIAISLSGSFTISFVMYPVMGSQCSQPVKLKMSQTGVPEVFLSGTFGMYPKFRPQCTTFGKILGHFGKMLSSFKMYWIFQFP